MHGPWPDFQPSTCCLKHGNRCIQGAQRNTEKCTYGIDTLAKQKGGDINWSIFEYFEIWPDPESTEYWTYTQSKLSRTIGVGVGGRPAEHGIYIYMYIYIFNKFRVAIYQLSPPFIGEQKIPKHVRDWRSSTGWFYFWLQGLELNRLICHRFPGWGVNPKYMMCIYVYMYIYTTEVYHFAP